MASVPPAAADLTGRVAVVTGGAQGIGRAAVAALRAAGASVVLADNDGELGAAAAHQLGARFVATDVTLAHAVEMLFGVAENELGGVDILVNNAGGAVAPFFPAARPEDWGAVLDLNLRAPMRATQLALGAMRRRGGGAVVNVASIAGVGLHADVAPEYAAAKAGLIRFTGALRSLGEENIRVSAICPGWVDTPAAHAKAAAHDAAPVTMLSPERVAGLILELAVHPDSAGQVVVWPEDTEPYGLG